MTPAAAKKIIETEMRNRNLSFTKLTAKTVDFTDLARAKCIFVKIHGWQPTEVNHWAGIRAVAVSHGFRIE